MNDFHPYFGLAICLLFSCFVAGPALANSATADELYKQAEKKYLQFQTEKAVDLLHRALKKQPDHEPSRELLDEMGREPPSMESLRTDPDTDDGDTTESPPDQEPRDKETSDTALSSSETEKPASTKGDSVPGEPTSTSSKSGDQEMSAETESEVDTTTTRANNTKQSDTVREDTSPAGTQSRTKNESMDKETPETTQDTRPIIVPETPTDPTESAPAPPIVPSSGSSTDSPDTLVAQANNPLISPELNVDTTRKTTASQGQEKGPGDGGPDLQPVLRSSNDSSDTSNERLERPDQTASRTYQPNLNTANDVEFTAEMNERLAERIISERQENGYYLNWTDFRDRINPGTERFTRIRENFTIAIPILDINSASAGELSRLPYLSRDIASNIANFRFTYGSFSSVDELTEVPGIEESSLERVSPYLEAR